MINSFIRSLAQARKQIRDNVGLDYRYLFAVYVRIECNPYEDERDSLLTEFVDMVMFESPSQARRNVQDHYGYDMSIIYKYGNKNQ